ncbi:unnamed protein product [Mytilus coruscus]|uniref:Uncharacterized protein n=1 Tax=Mytilus coruscus TaxID=42192 RepID=A0A6J8A3Z9_MYTCO|nr:unnamed protein product [Mytilus coruscus]
MLIKLEAENKNVESGTLLSWANMAQNSLQMWNGFSSHQLVFGKNLNLPNLMQAQLPALEGTTSSEAFAKHFYMRHGKHIFRLRQMKESAELCVQKQGKERWLGPGKVVFQDGKVFVRHGGVFVRVSPNRLCKINNNLGENTEQDNIALKNSDTFIGKKLTEPNIAQKKSLDVIAETITSTQEDLSHEATTVSHNLNLIKKDDNIPYKLPGSDKWISASVLGRAGKATGGNKTWYNVKDHVSEEQKSVDLGSLEWNILEDQINDTEVHTTDEVDQTDSDIAKQLELEKLKQFNTYEEVEDGGQKTISTRWVITNKNGDTRARLVVWGFEEQSFIPKDIPTIGKGSIRIFLTFAQARNGQ